MSSHLDAACTQPRSLADYPVALLSATDLSHNHLASHQVLPGALGAEFALPQQSQSGVEVGMVQSMSNKWHPAANVGKQQAKNQSRACRKPVQSRVQVGYCWTVLSYRLNKWQNMHTDVAGTCCHQHTNL